MNGLAASRRVKLAAAAAAQPARSSAHDFAPSWLAECAQLELFGPAARSSQLAGSAKQQSRQLRRAGQPAAAYSLGIFIQFQSQPRVAQSCPEPPRVNWLPPRPTHSVCSRAKSRSNEQSARLASSGPWITHRSSWRPGTPSWLALELRAPASSAGGLDWRRPRPVRRLPL